jgi:diguanylate cyclase (GGDEF)-like protein/hemerythrin-like metal-binding protein
MLKEIDKDKRSVRLAILVSIATFAFLIFASSMFIYNYSMRIKEDNENKVNVAYYSLSDEISNYKNLNTSLLTGFAAYIELKDTFDGDEIYRYLDFLMRDHLEDIKNIGVFIDTTIRWVYPLEGNESAIGTDLSKVPGQALAVQRVKENLETLFVGPVELIQGGTAFIIRMPLLKNNAYWGMVSIVLKAENAFNFVDKFSEIHDVSYLITAADNTEKIIYGNGKILEMNPLKFRTDDSLGGWDVYVAPSGGWDNKIGQLIIIFSICAGVSLLIAWRIFSWRRSYNQILSDKIELESKYILDRFTGIYTRDYFNFRLKEEVSHVQRKKYPIAMIYFDLDHFKNVNDVYGHSAGDEVLLEIVAVVKSIIRIEDVFSRWGGDEFILLLPNTDLIGAKFVADRIRSEIESLEISKAYGVTASIGYSQWQLKEYLESWFLRTDQALYTSKNTGKNKVTASDHAFEKNILVRVDWDESTNSGCDVIDDEHKAILKRCNVIVESALEQSSFDETIRNVEVLILEMEQHFKDEIQILKDIEYPEVEKHQNIHDALMKKTNVIFQKTIQRDISAVEFFTFLLLTVVEGHFKNEDVKYFQYLLERSQK